MSERGEQLKAFLKELKPAITTPFVEARKLAPAEKEKLEAKLAVLRNEEAIARQRIHFIEAAGLQDYIQQLEARLIEHQRGKYNSLFSEMVRGISYFKKLPVLKQTYRYLRVVTFDYFAKQYKEGPATPVGTALDAEIPLKNERLRDYLSFVPYWISGVLFAQREFGERAEEDAIKIITDMAGFYAQAGVIFEEAQTTFHRGGSEGGAAIRFLRIIDKDKNMLPSPHAEVAAHTYSRLTDIINTHAHDPEDYALVKERFFRRAVRILEACLLTKQHAWRDVSASMVALSARDERFTKNRATSLMNAMFSESPGDVPPRVADELRQSMVELYQELMGRLVGEPNKDYTKVLIEYIQSLGKADGNNKSPETQGPQTAEWNSP